MNGCKRWVDHAWGWEPVTMDLIKAYKPESSSVSFGQVRQCPYDFTKAKLIVREMTDLLVLDLVDKKLIMDAVMELYDRIVNPDLLVRRVTIAANHLEDESVTGHGAAIQETARLTDAFQELDEDRITQLDGQLRLIRENQSRKPEIEVTYFQPDSKKSGGAYVTVQGRVKKIDASNHQVVFTDGTEILIESILAIECLNCKN